MKAPILKKQRRNGFTLVELMVVIAILAALASVGYGPILDHMNDGDRQKASSNLKNVFTLLQQFHTDHNQYPCDATAETLREEKSDLDFGELTGDNSNAYFRQLFYKGDVTSEKPFFAKVSTGVLNITTEADDKLAGGQALQAGENAMSYVMLRDKHDSGVKKSVKVSNAPLAMCSVLPSKTPYSGDKLLIDMDSFRGHLFVLFCDGSVNDMEKALEENPDDETTGVINKKKSIFPETKKGRDTTGDYLILTPEV